MSKRYDMAILSGTERLPLPTQRATGVTCSTGPRGFQDASAFLPLSAAQADQLSQRTGLRVRLGDGAGTLWEGRIEDLALRNGGVQLGALGDARALDDIRYTALWSDSQVSGWRELTPQDRAGRDPKVFTLDTNNRLFIGLRNGQSYAAQLGSYGYQAPDRGLRDIVAFSADVEHYLPNATWELLLTRFSGGFGGVGTLVQTITGTGALTPATINQTWAGPCDAIAVEVRYNSGTPAAYTGNDGARYVRLTNIRVKTTTAAAVSPLAVIQHIRDQVNAVNPGALSTSNRLMEDPLIDLANALWEDATPSAILDELAGYGDTSGQRYEWGVTTGRELYFRPVGAAAREWAIDAADLEVEQSLEGLANATYATYKEAGGRALRTATVTDAQSVARYGLTRQASIEADTASASTAATIAATANAATADAVPRSKVMVRRFSAITGAAARPEQARAGDTVTIRNLPPTASIVLDRIRTFTIAQTSFNLDTGEVEIIPESPTPDLEFQIAFVLKAARQ